MSRSFDDRKRKILAQLSVPEGEYDDLSPKGSVDVAIRPLVDEINARDEYVTTSSCAGRTAVFLEGVPKESVEQGPSEARSAEHASAGGKGGGGKWLYVSHDPLHLSQQNGSLQSLFGFAAQEDVSVPTATSGVRFVHFKFESMILHMLSSSLASAQYALGAAMSAGFRESGISNVVSVSASTTPMVAVRSAGISFDCIIGYLDETSGNLKPMVTDAYLRTMIQVANQRFAVNRERTARFRQALLERHEENPKDTTTWEPADVRRERKRMEGQQRQKELAMRQGLRSAAAHEGGTGADHLTIDEPLQDN